MNNFNLQVYKRVQQLIIRTQAALTTSQEEMTTHQAWQLIKCS